MRAVAIVLVLLFVAVMVVGCVCNPDKCTCSRDVKVKKFGEERVREAEAKKAAEQHLTPEKP